MTADAIVTDPFLRSVLHTSNTTRDQCIAILDALEANAIAQQETPSAEAQNELSKQQKLLLTKLSELRNMNRNAALAVRHTKHHTAEARSEIDKLHLQLQNLYYEQRHLRGEIDACESYDHKYQQLPLISIEQFLEKKPELAELDEHALMIARIEDELADREALESARQGLLKKKQGLIADNKKRKDDLASLDNDLEKFIDAAKPIQELLKKEY